jgi:hypothetical protein
MSGPTTFLPMITAKGIKVEHPSHNQNIIGNTLSGRILNRNSPNLTGPYAHNLWIEKNLICIGDPAYPEEIAGGDLDLSTIRDNILGCDQAASWRLPDSLYLSEKPDFWGDLPWLAVGADVDSQRVAAGLPLLKIPAQIRYEQITGLVPPEGETIVDDTEVGFPTSPQLDFYQMSGVKLHNKEHQ